MTVRDCHITVKNVYGKELIYPHRTCENAQLFAKLVGTKTFTNANLAHIERLGYLIVQITEPLKRTN